MKPRRRRERYPRAMLEVLDRSVDAANPIPYHVAAAIVNSASPTLVALVFSDDWGFEVGPEEVQITQITIGGLSIASVLSVEDRRVIRVTMDGPVTGGMEVAVPTIAGWADAIGRPLPVHTAPVVVL